MIGWIILGVLAVVIYFIIGFFLAGFYDTYITLGMEMPFVFVWPIVVPVMLLVKLFYLGFGAFSDLGMDCREKLKNRRKK